MISSSSEENDLFASPFASSSNVTLSTLTPSPAICSNNYNKNVGYAYRIVTEPPKTVFSGEWFDISFQITSSGDENDCTKKGTMSESKSPALHIYSYLKNYDPLSDTMSNCNQRDAIKLITDPEYIIVPTNAQSSPDSTSSVTLGKKFYQVKCQLLSSSDSHTRSLYCICFSSDEDKTATNFFSTIREVVSSPIQIVHEKFVLLDDETDPIFYKDEGGQGKLMRVTVVLMNRSSVVTTGKKVPIQFTLLYENLSLVSNQDNMRIVYTNTSVPCTTSKQEAFIDPLSGKFEFSYRIDDVSKNHQNQKFTLCISPRQQTGYQLSDIGPAYTKPVLVKSKRNKKRKWKLQDSSNSKIRSVQNGPKIGLLKAENKYDLTEHDVNDLHTLPFIIRNQVCVKAATKNIIEFINEVMVDLKALQWQIIGYNKTPEGLPNYEQPFHQLINPNNMISKTLKKYHDTISIDVHTILSSFNMEPSKKEMCSSMSKGSSSTYFLDSSMHNTVENYHIDEVHYILAKQFKSVKTNEFLGYPAYDGNMELIGFFQNAHVINGHFSDFNSINLYRNEFGVEEKTQAKSILESAIIKRSQSLFHKGEFKLIQ